ncbi:MAG: LptA/OstA family protein [Candidatus Velthaea sp.]
MNPVVGPVCIATALAWVAAAPPQAMLGSASGATVRAQTAPQSAVPATPSSAPSEALPSAPPEALPSASSEAAPSAEGQPVPGLGPTAGPSPQVPTPLTSAPASVQPGPGQAGGLPIPTPSAKTSGLPGSAATAAGRFHLHRPGTDVDGDLLTGSLASHVFVLKGNVTLHSDPKIDREMAEASESDEPLTVTADEIDADQLAFTYVAKGHVHFVQGNRSGFADLATLNETAHTLDLVGNATVLDGEHRTTAAKMHYDTLDKQFIGAGDVRIYAPLPTPKPSAATPPPKHKLHLPI